MKAKSTSTLKWFKATAEKVVTRWLGSNFLSVVTKGVVFFLKKIKAEIAGLSQFCKSHLDSTRAEFAAVLM